MPSYYIIEYSKTFKDPEPVGTLHVPRAKSRRFLKLVERLRSLGFIVKTQLID